MGAHAKDGFVVTFALSYSYGFIRCNFSQTSMKTPSTNAKHWKLSDEMKFTDSNFSTPTTNLHVI